MKIKATPGFEPGDGGFADLWAKRCIPYFSANLGLAPKILPSLCPTLARSSVLGWGKIGTDFRCPMATLASSRQILLKLTPELTYPVVVYTPSLVVAKDVPATARYTGFLSDLRLKSVINSLEEITLPEFELGQSKTAKMAIVRDLEYNNPRYNLHICLKTGNGPWLSIFEFSLQNRKPFFVTEILGYLTHQPLFTISPDTTLGVQFSDVGYGIPKTGDELILYGSVREEHSIPTPQIIQYFNTGTTDDPVIDIPDEVDMASLLPVRTDLTVQGYNQYNQLLRRNEGYEEILPYATLHTWDALKLAQLNVLIASEFVADLDNVVFTIPEAFRPSSIIAVACNSYGETYENTMQARNEFILLIHPDGLVKVRALDRERGWMNNGSYYNLIGNVTYCYA